MTANPPSRIAIIDYLRGLASLVVAWFHLTNLYEPTSTVRTSGALGYLGVDCFFVISGFVLPYLLSGVRGGYTLASFPRFMARRTVRLEPAFLVSIAMVIVLWELSALRPAFAGEIPAFTVPHVLANALYLVPVTQYEWLQPVYWTLAYELVFYIVIGLIFPLIAAGPVRDGRSQLPFLFVVGALMALAALQVIGAQWILFVMGLFVYKAVVERIGTGLLVAGLIASTAVMVLGNRADAAVVGLLTAVVIVLGRGFALSDRAERIFGGLGLISYSLYLVHIPIGGRLVNFGKNFTDGNMAAELGLSLFGLAVSLVAAVVFFLLIERPAHNLSRRIAMTRPRPGPNGGEARADG
ncbi:acyltransferase family protein [Erythrobacter arachoides]|uniref:Acyltransferase family protein n=1 Tax=Aurantiacibacter arachoides TaxID=1850444 RepID=A0A844ZYT5_9SPHN|nr:acyltransferase [Aurantiacibacter arachoides]MXO92402.1 acyltransferase family protein [Aurantiacibacter arachoides]GGD57451.1 acyltransferase [Aurantiacibacter arachoides]